MNRPESSSERVTRQVKDVLVRDGATRHRFTGSAVRSAAITAVKGTRSVGRGASNLGREAVEGVISAIGEVGAETHEFVRDAVIGVVEGTGQVVQVTTPAVREVVVGAIRGSSRGISEVREVGRDVVEGAMVGASLVKIDDVEAASAAAEGVVEAVVEVGGDLEDAAKATVGGVVSGVAAAGGDVVAATREAVNTLMTHAAVAESDVAEIAGVAGSTVDVALEEAERIDVDTQEVVVAAATRAVEAAYEVGPSHGDAARQLVLRRLSQVSLAVAPDLRYQISEVAERLSSELPRGRAAWRGAAIVGAARVLIHAGGIDLAGSLAYFTILSFLPLIALVILVVARFGDPEGFILKLTETLIYYFPVSDGLIREAVENLLGGSLVLGLVASVGMLIGANGLFMAANRAVNRIFGVDSVNVIQITIAEMSIGFLAVILFLLSLGVTALFEIVVNFGGGMSIVVGFVFGAVATALPAAITVTLFTFVYRRMPSVHMEWKDAVFGAIAAVILFEIGKHLFFWFTALSSHRDAVYGPIASVIVLMMWSYLGALIFLYGAALAKMAGELRPKGMR